MSFTKPLTVELLEAYSNAAIENATALLVEASLLMAHGHRCRAYFLSVASIEEIGKAALAFDAQGRNLADSAMQTKLKYSFENHSAKITAAFAALLALSPDLRSDVIPTVNLIIAIKHGREPSMYTDINLDKLEVQSPNIVVRDIAARDCVRLAEDCLRNMKKYFKENRPKQRDIVEDQLFTMKSSALKEIANTEDFWWYYLAQKEQGSDDWATAVVRYRSEFFLHNRLFREA